MNMVARAEDRIGGFGLTPREAEVFFMAVNGATSPEIGAALGISHKSVESHRSRILRKVGARSTSHAVALAFRSGYLTIFDVAPYVCHAPKEAPAPAATPDRAELDGWAQVLIARVLKVIEGTREGVVLTSGAPQYRRLDCDGRALAYVRVRPKKRGVRLDLSGLWVRGRNRSSCELPGSTGTALLLRSAQDVEDALRFLRAAVDATRARAARLGV